MKLGNTLTNKKEVFKPLDKTIVTMYNCGPTVYNYAHIGNMRSYVFADVLRRTLELNGYKVKQVLNITDVGEPAGDPDTGRDKIEESAKKEGKTAKEISQFYEKAFFDDLKKLNINITDTIFPHATEHIKEQIALIERLEQKDFTYKTTDGVYFDTSKFRDYGKLGNINLEGLEEGARIGVNKEKRNPTDFALWKFSKKGEARQQEWPSPWGVGFPGWHIECSAMSMKYLGETFDIHTGGIDHIPIHHNNEIAQSEAATGKQFVRYWLHNAFVNVPSGKMSKSENNFIRLKDLEDKGIRPLAYRYWLLTAHYHSPITFSFEAISAAETALFKLAGHVGQMPAGGSVSDSYSRKFKEIINNDLDTPGAVSLAWQLLKDTETTDADKRATIADMDKVLGLEILKLGEESKKTAINVPKEVKELLEKREIARSQKDWETADALRDEITNKGYSVEDTADGETAKVKKL